MKMLFIRSLFRQHRFIDQFVSTRLNLSAKCFKAPDQLTKYPPGYDIYITGSDQVWNHDYCYGDSSFFLDFAGSNSKKISYASSFGTNEVDDSYKELYADWLSTYNHLSVREASGVSIIQQLMGKKAEVVVDPTLLLSPSEWNELAKTPVVKDKYILCYYLNYSFNPFPYADDLAEHIRRITGYRIIRVGRPPDAFYNPHTVFKVGASPEEFVGLIRDAAIVLTTSFHGTAFALNFGVPVFAIQENRESSDSRQKSLLESVGLGNRILFPGDEFPDKEMLPCDYLKAHEQLSTLREASFSYLKSVLGDSGYQSSVYASWAKEDAIRTTSSSGGVFSVLANAIIDVGGYVFGAAFTDQLLVKHIGVNDRSELHRLKGSKYVKSDLTGIYRQVKDHLCNNNTVLFTGTPCQVAGLKSFLKMPYEKLFTCDVICHGVPSQEMFNLYLKQINILPDSENFSFRYCKGWGYELSYKNKPLLIKDSYYMKAFTKGFMFMEACYKCKYATPDRISDITLGDYWGIGAEKSFNHSKKKGVSLVLINSEKGEQLLDVCRNKLFLEKRELQEAIAGNHNLHVPANRPEQRNSFCRDMRLLSKEEIMDKYSLHPSVRDYLRPVKRFFMQFAS